MAYLNIVSGMTHDLFRTLQVVHAEEADAPGTAHFEDRVERPDVFGFQSAKTIFSSDASSGGASR